MANYYYDPPIVNTGCYRMIVGILHVLYSDSICRYLPWIEIIFDELPKLYNYDQFNQDQDVMARVKEMLHMQICVPQRTLVWVLVPLN
jgi:hypothetical protein